MINNPLVEENPTQLPGTCFSCGCGTTSPGRIWLVDTTIDYFDTPMYRIQCCNICFDLLANACGYIKIGEEVDQYKRAIAGLEEKLNGLERYRRLADLLGIDDDRLNRLLTLDQVDLRAESPDDVKSGSTKRSGKRQNTGEMGSGKTGLSESPDDEGVEQLRSVERDISVRL